MGKYTGKCDLYDHFYMNDESIEEQLKKVNIYFWDYPYAKLDIKTEKDLSQFYCHIPSVITNNNIYLPKRNYLDRREKEELETVYNDLVKLYKKCKRKHLNFEEEYNKIKQDRWFFYSGMTDEEKDKIFNLVKISKGKADIDSNYIPLSTHNYWRETWYEDLIKLGWEEEKAYLIAYGFERWIQRNIKED
jgi:hypothetical protein